MINQQLLDYIKQQTEQGINNEDIKKSLLASGWQEADIQSAFNSSVSSTSGQTKPVRRFKKMWLVIIAIAAGALIIGGGVYAYFNYYQSPEKIVTKMRANLPKIKSLEYSGALKIEVKIDNIPAGYGSYLQLDQQNLNNKTGTYTIDFAGSSDINDLESPKGQFNLSIKADVPPSEEYTTGLEIIVIDKIIYLKFDDLPNVGIMDFSAFKDQWIKFDVEALAKQYGGEKFKEISNNEQNKRTEEDKKMLEAFDRAKVVRITDRLASEKINGIDTYHYKYVFDKQGTKKFLADYNKIFPEKALTEKELKDFDKFLEAIEPPEGEIWIGKKDFLPRKIYFYLNLRDFSEVKMSGKIDFILQFNNFNQPIQTEIPAQTKTIEEVLEEFYRGFFSSYYGMATSSASQTIDIDQDSDNDGLTDQIEEVYGTDPYKADTDGDGYNDKEEIENGYDPNGIGKLY